MIRSVVPEDKEPYIAMTEAFYRSDAVLHSIPQAHIQRTFETILNGSPYAQGYIAEHEGKTAGYVLLAMTYSNEAGGLVLWIEEIYIVPEFRGLGLGGELFAFIESMAKSSYARIRLESEPDNLRALALYQRMGYADLSYRQLYKDL
ncbi:MAG TPA: GNAT family N-acetyltransferase [Peptococcaceae bacterium]|nr:GNAT family N-acetyltransferase [Peptococcaceae bacterium]